MAHTRNASNIPPERRQPDHSGRLRSPLVRDSHPGRPPVHRWIAGHPVATFLIWFFTVGQAFAFAPLVARRAYGMTLPAEPFVVASTLIGLLLPTLAITWTVDGHDGVRLLWRRIQTVRVPLGWYALAILGVPLTTLGLTVACTGYRRSSPPAPSSVPWSRACSCKPSWSSSPATCGRRSPGWASSRRGCRTGGVRWWLPC